MGDQPVNDPLGRELAKLETLMALARDRQGHPCRDCGVLYREHPNAGVGPGVPGSCQEWR